MFFYVHERLQLQLLSSGLLVSAMTRKEEQASVALSRTPEHVSAKVCIVCHVRLLLRILTLMLTPLYLRPSPLESVNQESQVVMI